LRALQETPSDRATSFQPVQGGGEHYSGEVLLVAAYGAIWTVLFLWLVLVWRKQAAIASRLDDLQREINRAAADKGKPLAR
jgi:CcmD family protein